jgi:hypothetical protein
MNVEEVNDGLSEHHRAEAEKEIAALEAKVAELKRDCTDSIYPLGSRANEREGIDQPSDDTTGQAHQ